MEPLGIELKRHRLEVRKKLEDIIAGFYDGSSMADAWRKLTPAELGAMDLRSGVRIAVLRSNRSGIRQIDSLRAQVRNTVARYADALSAKDSAIPDVMRSRLDTELNGFVSDTLDELYNKMRIGFDTEELAKRTTDSMADIFDKRASRLSGVVESHYKQFEKYLLLRGYELAGHESFRFVVDEKQTTCELCLSQKGKVYTAEELAANGMFPPLHPNCGCYLVTMSGERVEDGAETSDKDIK